MVRAKRNSKTVLVGMSGGVDSSVTAHLLLEQGYKVIGVFMRKTGFLKGIPGVGGCLADDEQNIEDAASVARLLSIPFHIIDVSPEYRKRVFTPFLDEYRAGRTPNPCVICNRFIKFESLLANTRTAGIVFDFFATGHYARLERSGRRWVLRKARNRKKDQSYFLWRLTQKQLAGVLFPLGTFTKKQVRHRAEKAGLPVSAKEESQDFIVGDRSPFFPGGLKSGPIKDVKGNILGRHRGIELYTVGQRKGLGIAHPRPLYVSAIDAETDTIIVGEQETCYASSLTASCINWVSADPPARAIRVTAKVRSVHTPVFAMLTPLGKDKIAVRFEKPQWAVTPGQSVVCYRGDVLVCGGTIE